jgi:hypothetical protein
VLLTEVLSLAELLSTFPALPQQSFTCVWRLGDMKYLYCRRIFVLVTCDVINVELLDKQVYVARGLCECLPNLCGAPHMIPGFCGCLVEIHTPH